MKQPCKTSKQPNRARHRFLARVISVTLMMLVACLTIDYIRSPRPGAGCAKATVGQYWWSGQWRADFRTLVAAVDLLVTPDPDLCPPMRGAVANTVEPGTNTSALRARATLTEPQLEALRNALRVRLLA